MHTDLKIQTLIEKHGLEGYAIFNLCLEIVGKEGIKGKIDGQLRWREVILKVSGWSEQGKLDKILNTMAEVKLICPKSFKYGNLYIPKFIKRADDYTMRLLRIKSEQDMNNVRVEENRIEKNRIDKIIDTLIERKGWDKNNKDLVGSIYKRHCKPAKELLLLINNDDYAKRVVNWVADMCRNKGLGWTLETVIKWLPDFMSKYPMPDNTPKELKDLTKNIGKIA